MEVFGTPDLNDLDGGVNTFGDIVYVGRRLFLVEVVLLHCVHHIYMVRLHGFPCSTFPSCSPLQAASHGNS